MKSNRGAIPCRRCGYAITWAGQRRQFTRAIQRGLTSDAAKELMPLCQQCITEAFREAGIFKDPVRYHPRLR